MYLKGGDLKHGSRRCLMRVDAARLAGPARRCAGRIVDGAQLGRWMPAFPSGPSTSSRCWLAVTIAVCSGATIGCDDRRTPSVSAGPQGKPITAPTLTPATPETQPGGEAVVASAVTLAALPTCASANADDPLAVVCTLGAEAGRARFECDAPQPLSFCRQFVDWSCRYDGYAGESPPKVSYRARFAQTGPPPKHGDMTDPSAFSREGRIKGTSVFVAEKSNRVGAEIAARWAGQVEQWGCAVTSALETTTTFDCGAWNARTSYNEIIHQVIFDAAEEDAFNCP
jgi:hypothetical protein